MANLQHRVSEWVGSVLPQDVRAWCQRFATPKIIHDALWGTFRLERHEAAILDTPLLQRLRRIHQTGAASLTFPCASHSRFEHSLGVLFHANRMMTALQERHPGDNRLHAGNRTNIRLAALLHDTGHGPYSHTSEQYFSLLDDIAEAKTADRGFRESGAGEILSCYIVGSQPFRDFARQLETHFGHDIDPDLIISLISGSVQPHQVFLSEIIHGPFDADKLDYMHRDGIYSGLKMHVDIDRLLASIEIMSGTDEEANLVRLAGSMAGTSPLMQIMFNKMLLYTGMYHHHKVRTVDCMLWAIFDLARERNATIGGHRVEYASDFLKITDDTLLVPELCNDSEIKELIVRVRDRDLWKRALVLARETVSQIEGPFTELAVLGGNEPAKIRRRRAISDRIWDEAGHPCKKHEVWLDVPSQPSVKEGKRMWIKSGGPDDPRLLMDVLPIDQWVKLYGTSQWRAYVFAPDEARAQISGAARRVLHAEFGLETNERAVEYCKMGRT